MVIAPFWMLVLQLPSSIRLAPRHPSPARAITAMFCKYQLGPSFLLPLFYDRTPGLPPFSSMNKPTIFRLSHIPLSSEEAGASRRSSSTDDDQQPNN